MDELLRQVKTVVRSMWRHRHLAMIVTWIAGAIGAVAVMIVPDKYEASARIYVDTQSILQPLMAGLAVQPNVEQQVMMLSRTLLSRPNMEKLVRMADLDLGSKDKAAQDALIDSLSKKIEVKGTSRDNLYTLAYRDTVPEQAKRVVQALTSIFVESSLGDKRKDSDTAKKFIDDQIRGYEKKLEEAEARLKDFKLRNLDLQTADGKSGVDRLGDIGNQLNTAKLALREVENARDAIKKQLAGEDAATSTEAPSGDPASLTPELDGRIDAMKRNLDTLLQRFTEQHPDVTGARRVLKELEEQRKQEVAARKKVVPGGPSVVFSSNPVFQKLKIALGENEAQAASLRARVAEYEARYTKVKESLKLAPQLEAEFAQLNRDYDINKKNFESLVSRRESASITGELGSTSGVADFRLIDPPRVEPRPVAPNRLLLLPGGLAFGLIAGLLASFVAAQVRPVFHDGRTLSEITGLPLLGMVSVSLTSDDVRKARRSLYRFAAALAGLFLLYGIGYVVLYIKLQTPV